VNILVEWFERTRTPLTVILLGMVASLIVIGLRSLGFLQFIELANYDIYLRLKEQQTLNEPRVVLVQTVEEDIQKLAEWPLTDSSITNVLKKLLAYDPRAIGVDLYRDIAVPPGTEVLSELLASEKRIIAIEKFGDEHSKHVGGPEVLRGTEQIGFSDITVDDDGVVRRGLLFLDDGETTSVSLALRLSMIYLAEEGITPQPGVVNSEHIRLGSVTWKPLEANDAVYVNADARGYQYILDYRGGGPDRFKTYSLSDVLEGRVEPSLIKDSVIIVGVNAESVKDELLTPYDRFTQHGQATAGMVVHGFAVSQLIRAAIDGDVPVQFLSDYYENLWILLWGIAAALAGLYIRSGLRLSIVLSAGLLVLVGTTSFAFINLWWLPVTPVAFAWLISAMLVTSFLSGHEKKEKKYLMDIFSKSVSTEVADEMWKHRSDFLKGGRLKPQTMTVTVLFCDLADFTPVAERLSPEELMGWLNKYMETMTGIIMKHGGVVDDYYGDAIKVNFGVPLPRTKVKEIQQDAISAIRCALAMRHEMKKLNMTWVKGDSAPVKMRIGLATGSVVAGCLGSAERMKYTTIGDIINTAARLESYGKEIDEKFLDPFCQVMVAASTAEKLPDKSDLELVGTLRLKGKSQGVDVFALKGAQ
jgi:adenylate cyclase